MIDVTRRNNDIDNQLPDYTDGIIDLYLYQSNINTNAFCYHIYLHNEQTYIGNIIYHSSKYERDMNGDVGYEIFKQFQGNNYATRALALLNNKIKEIGDQQYEIFVEPDNIASIKTVENCGGILLSKNKKNNIYICTIK